MSIAARDTLLAVSSLSVEFRSSERVVAAVRDVSFNVGRGETIAIVGESGSGKPMTALNPVYTVGEQIAESIRLHQGKDHAAARRESLRMLEQVRIPEATQVLDRHPHQLYGGIRQRVMIAMAR